MYEENDDFSDVLNPTEPLCVLALSYLLRGWKRHPASSLPSQTLTRSLTLTQSESRQSGGTTFFISSLPLPLSPLVPTVSASVRAFSDPQ